MRVISMVPSWTETLLECQVQVVGRTRYCIHPCNKLKEIKVVGGTKDFNLELIRDLQPDLILLDQEENSKAIFDAFSDKCQVTHIEKVEDVSKELKDLGLKLKNENLLKLANRWQAVAEKKIASRDFEKIPGVLNWLRPPSAQIDCLVYVIWRAPWMAVNQDTFIASVIRHLGFGERLRTQSKKYYEFEMKDLPQNTLLLFSSEPFPFVKFQNELLDYGAASAIVDGESFSWFGVRSLQFLENNK